MTILLLTLIPAPALCQPKLADESLSAVDVITSALKSSTPAMKPPLALEATVTAYCLTSPTSWGIRTRVIHEQSGYAPIALSRCLAEGLGLKKGPRTYDYEFGVVIEVIGVGNFLFCDLMPPKWKHNRVDLWCPTYKEAARFGRKTFLVRVRRDLVKFRQNDFKTGRKSSTVAKNLPAT